MLKAEFDTTELDQALSNFSIPQILSKIEQRRSTSIRWQRLVKANFDNLTIGNSFDCAASQ